MGKSEARRHIDSAAVLQSDGSLSAAALHEALTEGTDDREFRIKTRVKLLRDGSSAADLDRVLPKLNESDLQRISRKFKRWTGAPLQDSYGNKPLIDWNGVPLFAELAMLRDLRQQGYEDAVWVDTYRRSFRNEMPPDKCTPPPFVLKLHTDIRNQNAGKWAGCFDLMAWTGNIVSFVELKWKGRDRMRDGGWAWVENALRVGINLEQFSICDWEFTT